MNTKLLIVGFMALIGFLSYSTIVKIKENSKQTFKVITWDKYDVCFLIPDIFTVEKQSDGFKYVGGQNTGHIILSEGSINSDYIETQIGDFKAGYKKQVDLRLFQYEVSDGIIISDTFDFAKKKPANIIPVRKNCPEYLKRFKVLFKL